MAELTGEYFDGENNRIQSMILESELTMVVREKVTYTWIYIL